MPLDHFIPLVLGGVLGGAIRRLDRQARAWRGLMTAVEILIVLVSVFQLLRAFRLI